MRAESSIFLDTATCSWYVIRCFGGTYHLHLQSRKQTRKEQACSRRCIQKDGNILKYCCENLKFYFMISSCSAIWFTIATLK
jgi:hypothetical protein